MRTIAAAPKPRNSARLNALGVAGNELDGERAGKDDAQQSHAEPDLAPPLEAAHRAEDLVLAHGRSAEGLHDRLLVTHGLLVTYR